MAWNWQGMGGGAASGAVAGSSFGPWGALAGGLGGGLMGGFMGNPADEASGYLDKIPDILKQYYGGYQQGGQQAYGNLQSQYGQLMNDPGGMLNKIGQGYQKSPGFDFQMQQGLGGINNAAGAGGMLGSPMHQKHAGEMATNLANQDYYNYLNKAMGMYGVGLEGEQGLNQMGYNASNELAGGIAGNMQSQASLGYAGQQNQNNMLGSMFKDALGFYGGMKGMNNMQQYNPYANPYGGGY